MKCPGGPAARGISSAPTLVCTRTGATLSESGPLTSRVTATSTSVPGSILVRPGVMVTVIDGGAGSGGSGAGVAAGQAAQVDRNSANTSAGLSVATAPATPGASAERRW